MSKNEIKKNKKNLLLKISIVILALIFVVSAVMLTIHLWPEKKVVEVSSTVSKTAQLPENPINFTELKAKNPDIEAYIKVPGTVIDYPVLRSGEEKDTNYYLNHDETGKYKFAGSVYMQKINSADFSDRNTVLYGHNMLNGSMFASIHKFKNKEFFDKNRTIYIYTPGHILTYEIYSCFVYDDRHILNSFDFSNDEQYQNFLNTTLNPASMVQQVNKNIKVDTASKIITLSTCTSKDNERLLLLGVLKNDQSTK